MTKNNQLDKILFLWLDDNQFHAVNAARRGVSVARIYRKMNSIEKIIRRIQVRFNLPGTGIWMNPGINNMEKYDFVIIHASRLAPAAVKYIREIDKSIRIIVWYWNPVDKCVSISKFDKYNCEIWSFDEKDCEKYNLKFNTQYYFNDINTNSTTLKQDVFFLGSDKGRMPELMKIRSRLDESEISNYFHITAHKKTKDNKSMYKYKYREKISYDKSLEHISQSKAILDYVSENQTGLTLRPLEALFFKKKLITNDYSIKERDFYTAENIFILGRDKIEDLPLFLNLPYKEIDIKILNKYDFDCWIKRFYKTGKGDDV